MIRARTPLPLLATAGALALLVAGLLAAPRAGAGLDEYQVKAAFLLNFAKLVEWPETARPAARQPLVVSVLGSETVRDAIATGMGDTVVDEHPIAVRRISRPAEARGSHILFVPRDSDAPRGEAIAAGREHSMLVVGEAEGFAADGGTINFFEQDRKIRFEINPGAARDAGLKISSRLLRLAVLIGEGR